LFNKNPAGREEPHHYYLFKHSYPSTWIHSNHNISSVAGQGNSISSTTWKPYQSQYYSFSQWL
jgi:hypothetical protein